MNFFKNYGNDSTQMDMRNTIKISKDASGRITVAFSYDPDRVEKVKTVGYKWHPEEKYWSFPYSDSILDNILSIFSEEKIDVDPSLKNLMVETKISKHFEDLRRELVLRKYSRKSLGLIKSLLDTLLGERGGIGDGGD